MCYVIWVSLKHWFWVIQAIGAEYGEGFETFRHDGPLKVDVVSKYMKHAYTFM